ncbi:MAG TPA: BNR repeat-containing protein [Chitinophagaceae bacterium]|nr:BNR repeat-containing protein [Chitinophagaceae bacterium]
MNKRLIYPIFFILYFFDITAVVAQKGKQELKIIPVENGWANNSINTTVFRKNSLVTFKDTQFISFYNKDKFVVLGKRKLGTDQWQLKQTAFVVNTSVAHNVISIMVDGDGYVHLAWNHHNNALHYARSTAPGSLEMSSKMSMTGKGENSVTYPEFYKMPDGNLLFFYRDGGSGQGDLVINKYNKLLKQWTQLHSNLIDGERKRNAYWQACVDAKGTIHISWVWRESPDVASNHDMAYACSKDGGITWQKTNREKYQLPINAASAEYALHIPQNSELINQTSMTTDEKGNPFIATYWRAAGTTVPQYQLVYFNGNVWKTNTLELFKIPFSLNGMGSKRIPIARPQIMVKGSAEKASVIIVFRAEERGSKASVAIIKKLNSGRWFVKDITKTSVGSWEPTYDTELWKVKGLLHLFVQNVEQVDGEGKANIPPQKIEVYEWKPRF